MARSCEKLNLKCEVGSLPNWAWSFLQNRGICSDEVSTPPLPCTHALRPSPLDHVMSQTLCLVRVAEFYDANFNFLT